MTRFQFGALAVFCLLAAFLVTGAKYSSCRAEGFGTSYCGWFALSK